MFDHIQPVTLTERAAEAVKHIMDTKNIPADYGLRIGVRGGGCGVSLIIGFDKKTASDMVYTIEGIPIYIEKKHTMYVMGKQVDFVDHEDARGFTFIDSPQTTA